MLHDPLLQQPEALAAGLPAANVAHCVLQTYLDSSSCMATVVVVPRDVKHRTKDLEPCKALSAWIAVRTVSFELTRGVPRKSALPRGTSPPY